MEVIKKDLKEIEQIALNNTKKIEDVSKKTDDNVKLIIENMKKLHNHEEKIQKNSYALDILKDYKKESKRLFIALLVTLGMWFITIGYLIYTLVK